MHSVLVLDQDKQRRKYPWHQRIRVMSVLVEVAVVVTVCPTKMGTGPLGFIAAVVEV